MADHVGLTKAQAKAAIATSLDIIQDMVFDGEKVTLSGFGTFERAKRRARKGRNPYTGETVNVPARVVAKFRMGKTFKESLNPAPKKVKRKAKKSKRR